MNLADMRNCIIRPTLKTVGLWSPSAENLLLGTMLVESGGEFLKQHPGPALGLYQCEPATHQSIKDYLNIKRNSILKDKVLTSCYMSVLPPDDALVWNLRYATLISRLVYYRSPVKLPDASDAIGLATYHKTIYNTSLGKTNVDSSVSIFQSVIKELASEG
jgi:hypothetical protein